MLGPFATALCGCDSWPAGDSPVATPRGCRPRSGNLSPGYRARRLRSITPGAPFGFPWFPEVEPRQWVVAVQRPETGSIPDAPGSYQFLDAQGRVIYVGKAKSLRSRLSNYFAPPETLLDRTRQMVQSAERVEWIVAKNEVEAFF